MDEKEEWIMDKKEAAYRLLEFTGKGVSPYHVVQESQRILRENGFTELSLGEKWSLERGGKYYVNIYGTTCIAFRINSGFEKGQGIRIAAAHTDWPCLRIKSNPEMSMIGYRKLNVEVYGGPIDASWFDRPLSIAGKVSCKGHSSFAPECHLVDFKRPMLVVPNLAIHMNRDLNNGYAYNAQKDLLPIWGMDEDDGQEQWFLQALAEEIGVPKEDIYGFDLYVYVAEKGCLIGWNEEMLSSPRIDNLTSCQSCIQGLIRSSRQEGIDLIAMFDNEECGSRSKQGADSRMLPTVLEKVTSSLGMTREEHLDLMWNGFFVSLDVAHASHPNYREKSDPTNRMTLAPAVVVKLEPNQRYATDSRAVAVVESICRKRNIPCRKFVNRSDIRGGSTIGSITSSWLPMLSVDIGAAILAMHSARETMGAETQACMDAFVEAYFTEN